jgi:hypothetical protein
MQAMVCGITDTFCVGWWAVGVSHIMTTRAAIGVKCFTTQARKNRYKLSTLRALESPVRTENRGDVHSLQEVSITSLAGPDLSSGPPWRFQRVLDLE